MYDKLAELLFPHISKTPDDYEKLFPKRNLPPEARVTRLAPSPTGFIHLGNLYGAFVDERLARQSGGVFFLRIEDTDEKRKVDGAVGIIINSLRFFGVDFDEGESLEGGIGQYGPYQQSERAEIYQCFAKEMVRRGLAYPCFMTEDEISAVRQKQEEMKIDSGIYGSWALCRNSAYDEVESKVRAGAPYVMRLRSAGSPGSEKTVSVDDAIRGQLAMPENFQDIVILKTNGIPTYHFAHVIDDHLMRTTHVVRGAEWISSLPSHIELFGCLGFEMPVFCHTAQLMKLDENGNKRKLSKREDPELSLDYYRREGYHHAAVREYMLTILNSNYEEWRAANPDASFDDFRFTLDKMSVSGALFDLDKLNNISKDVLARIAADKLCDFMKEWAAEFYPQALPYFADKIYVAKILDLGRTGERPRKDLICASQILDFIGYFFDEHFKSLNFDPYPSNVTGSDVSAILTAYLETYEHSDNQEMWFDKIRILGANLGYAAKPKDYKKNPETYKGHVGDVSTVIRVALTGRAQSPDIWEIQQILGEERTRRRITEAINPHPPAFLS
ncbi:MAG: glutamate--tRNA ligase [Leptospirales bacterium]|nr:glutamate--tRNA ligase [Leptospirales bacterium]